MRCILHRMLNELRLLQRGALEFDLKPKVGQVFSTVDLYRCTYYEIRDQLSLI